METPICERGSVDLHLHVVQSIRLSVEAMKRIFHAGTRNPEQENFPLQQESLPAWLKQFNKYDRVYDHLMGAVLEGGNDEALQMDLAQRKVYERMDIASYVGPHCIKAFLLFDYRTVQWLVVYEMSLKFSTEELLAITSESVDGSVDSPGAERFDLYNTLRNVFVNSDKHEGKSAWVISAEDEAKRMIVQTVELLYGVVLEFGDIDVVESNGNITNFFLLDKVNATDAVRLRKHLEQTHRDAERIREEVKPIIEDEHTLYIFKGRFHTIALDDSSKEEQYMPIQFHAQYLWCYLSAMGDLVRDAEDSILAKRFGKSSRDDSLSIDAIINSVQYAVFMNAGFKRAIESDSELVFKKIEGFWHLGSSLNQLEKFSEHLSGHLQRNYQRFSSDAEHRQSNALFLLSVLQILALLSVWADYLALLESEHAAAVMQSGSILALFGNIEQLQAFNVCLPLLLIALSALVFLYVVLSRRKK